MQRKHCLFQAVVWRILVKFFQSCLLGYTGQLLFFQGLPSSKDSTLNGSTSLLCSWMPLMFGFPIIPSIAGPQPTQGQWSQVAYQSPATIYYTYLSLHSRLCSTSRTLFQPCSRKPPSYFWLCSESFLFPWQWGIWKSKTNKRLLFPFQNSPLPVGMSEWPKCGARQGEGMVEIITIKFFLKITTINDTKW